MAGLTGLYVVLAFLEDSSDLTTTWLTAALASLCALFVAEFLLRLVDAGDRLAYVRRHWLDLVTAIPFIGPLRAVRVLRLLRFLRLSVHIRTAISSRSGHRRQADDNTWLLWPFLVLFWTCAAYGLWMFEAGTNPAISSYGSAMLAALLTAATLGYGGVVPTTIGGKLVAGTIVFVSIGLVGFASSRLTTIWLGQKQDRVPEQVAAMRRELYDMRKGIERIERSLLSATDPSASDAAEVDLAVLASSKRSPS